MRYTVRPISDRTPFTGRHQVSAFSAPWTATQALLLREVLQLGGRDLVIEADVAESDIRVDGWIRANARPSSPAVRVAFESKHGPLVYATDRFSHWQDNVRAVALALEALRKVDRYGITRHGEQYTGWKAIEASTSMTHDAALAVIWELCPESKRDEGLDGRYRWARSAVHPDRHGGDRTLWDRLEQAGRFLGVAS